MPKELPPKKPSPKQKRNPFPKTPLTEVSIIVMPLAGF